MQKLLKTVVKESQQKKRNSEATEQDTKRLLWTDEELIAEATCLIQSMLVFPLPSAHLSIVCKNSMRGRCMSTTPRVESFSTFRPHLMELLELFQLQKTVPKDLSRVSVTKKALDAIKIAVDEEDATDNQVVDFLASDSLKKNLNALHQASMDAEPDEEEEEIEPKKKIMIDYQTVGEKPSFIVRYLPKSSLIPPEEEDCLSPTETHIMR